MNVLPSSPRQTRSILVDFPSRKSGPVSRSRYSMMSLTLASGGSRTLSRPMSKSLLPLSANTALKPASSVRSTYRPGVNTESAAPVILPAFRFPFLSRFCPAALPPAESFLKFPIVFRLKVMSAMIVLSRLPGNKETSKDERNRKICAGARKVVWCPRHRFTMASGKGYRERLQKRYNLARELLSSGILLFRLEYRSLKTL